MSRVFILILCFFFFKQKTAYEMRISDWSSDVCSSDLAHQWADIVGRRRQHPGQRGEADAEAVGQRDHARDVDAEGLHEVGALGGGAQVGAELGDRKSVV